MKSPPEKMGGDELIFREAERWRHATPTERLAECERMCAHFDFYLSVFPPDVQEQLLAREPLPDDTIALLESLRREWTKG